MKYYTGVGSRATPLPVLEQMTKIAELLASKGYTLRSGGAVGADTAFEKGAGDDKEIWLPWNNFNNNSSKLLPSKQAFEIASHIHPKWSVLKDSVKSLHARNVHQVLGIDLQTPSNFLICWTEGGAIIGGTATSIKLAINNRIPVLNLAKYQLSALELVIEDFLIIIGEHNEV